MPEVPLMFWAAVLIADLLVIGLAFRGGLILPVRRHAYSALLQTEGVSVSFSTDGVRRIAEVACA